MRRNLFLTPILIICTWVNALPVSAQKTEPKPGRDLDVKLALASDAAEFFGGARRSGESRIFADLLTKTNGGDRDAADAVEAQGIYFFEQFRNATKDQLKKAVEKARDAAKKRDEQLKAKGGAKTVPSGKRATVKYDDVPAGPSSHIFRNAAFAPAPDGPQITTSERENGIDVSGVETKTIETPTATIIRTADASSTINFDGKQMSTMISHTDKTEATSKIDNKKLGETTKIEWGAAFDVCPDAAGIVRGTGRVLIYHQTTINTGRDLAALTSDTVVDVKITAYVDDAAEMTHFDMEGTATENMLGYDRALDHGLVEDTRGIIDGEGAAEFEVKNSTPPATAPRDEYGWQKNVSPVLGPSKVRATTGLSDGQASRISDALGRGVQGVMIELEPLMRSSISRWQNYECVDVECTAPKTALKPGEIVDVTATSVSKQDQSKIAAALEGSGDAGVTPENQRGIPSAVYSLTAPKEDKAHISVKSTSRRGIGLGSLEIPVVKPKKPPVKTPPKPKADPIWTGTVKVVHTEKEEREAPAHGRMEYERWKKDKRWEVSLTIPGTRDLSGGIVNNFHAETSVNYTGRDYNERSYSAGKMSCGKNSPIIMSPELQKFEIVEKGSGNQLLLATISITGTQGYIGFGTPEVQAERTLVVKYETKCASYDAVNSKVDTDPRGVSIGGPGFEVEFQIDPAHPDEISGTKTVVNVDGSEDVFTWNLARGKP